LAEEVVTVKIHKLKLS